MRGPPATVRAMQRTSRRALAVLAAAALATAGCGGAGYGDPIAATDGDDATVALAPAPVTTPGTETRATGARPGTTSPTTTARTPDGGASPSGGGSAGGDGFSGDTGGGSSGGGGSVLAAYAEDADRFCSGFKSATRTLTERIGAAGSNTKGVGRAIVRYGDAITSAASGLRAAAVPAGAGTYHQETLDWVRGVTQAIRDQRRGLQNGDAAAGAAVVQQVQDLEQPPLGSAVPAVLRSRATSCAS